jgi:hypothetical protein
LAGPGQRGSDAPVLPGSDWPLRAILAVVASLVIHSLAFLWVLLVGGGEGAEGGERGREGAGGQTIEITVLALDGELAPEAARGSSTSSQPEPAAELTPEPPSEAAQEPEPVAQAAPVLQAERAPEALAVAPARARARAERTESPAPAAPATGGSEPAAAPPPVEPGADARPGPSRPGSDADRGGRAPGAEAIATILGSVGLGTGTAGSRALQEALGCEDPIAGVWTATQFRSSRRDWGRMTLRIERHGDELRGTIRSRIWSGLPSDRRPLPCGPGRFDITVTMPARGRLDGDRFTFGADSYELTRVDCRLEGLVYYPDRFRGRVDTMRDQLDALNNDGHVEFDQPYTFRRTSCGS